MVTVSGAQRHKTRLSKITAPASRSLIDRALYVAGQKIEIDAEISITSGSISGAGHIPSRPGEPPNADTRLLDTNINTVVVGPGRVNVEAVAPYAAYLEFGTSRMAARPFMEPAARKNRKEAVELIRRAVQKTTEGVS